MADGPGRGRIGKGAVANLRPSGGAWKFLAQLSPAGPAGRAVLRRGAPAGCLPERQKR